MNFGRLFLWFPVFLIPLLSCGQVTIMYEEKTPYFNQIPDYPEEVTPASVLTRMVEGLGYRFYWVTKDLRPEDLEYRPSDDGKSTLETIEHILELSRMVRNSIEGLPNIRPVPDEDLSYPELRARSLENLKVVSQALRADLTQEIEGFNVTFQRGETTRTYPFWNMINGPLSDALYHTGQIVAYRRASGNPVDPNVSVFHGKNR
ncbi:MAG: hypothetical protein R3275_12715 [Saprospiraceae bacterium]|nr:hypothetical protein [Saprospiraceae bacterium]